MVLNDGNTGVVLVMFKVTLILCSLFLVGCDAINCVINNHPEFSRNNVQQATLNQEFEDAIRASISNSIEDHRYSYTWTFEGDLPQGISTSSTAREFQFSGTPTELGEFPFLLKVVARPTSVAPDEMPENLCSDTESREMVFSVVQGF